MPVALAGYDLQVKRRPHRFGQLEVAVAANLKVRFELFLGEQFETATRVRGHAVAKHVAKNAFYKTHRRLFFGRESPCCHSRCQSSLRIQTVGFPRRSAPWITKPSSQLAIWICHRLAIEKFLQKKAVDSSE